MTVTQESRWRAELEIIKELGRMPSTREMQKLLLDKKGMTVHHSTISEDFKRDLESLTKTEYNNQKGGILSMLNNLITIANDIAENGTDDKIRLDAMKTISKLDKTKTDVLVKFRKAQIEIDKKERPIFNVFIGKPKVIAMGIYRKKQKELREMVGRNDEDI
jgi:hypothetical protein